jgi:tellurite resistance protein TerC
MVDTIGFPVTTLAVFIVLVVTGIVIDLYSHKADQPITIKNAAWWSVFWVFVSCLFGTFLYFNHSPETASLFFAGYILEKTLSIDNLFVFMAIFGAAAFNIPENLRHRVLYWGIIGAIIFRLIFVAIGTSLISLSGFVEIIFGLIVAWTAWMMLKASNAEELEEEVDYTKHKVCIWAKKFFPVTDNIHGNHFFIKREIVDTDSTHFDVKKVWCATPLFLCLLVIEFSDVMFAFDSVPAVIAVSKDPLIIYSSMIFAILGLRTMYFLLEAMKKYFLYLETAVIGVLFFIGGKLIINALDHMYNTGFSIHHMASLWVVAGLIGGSMIYSVLKGNKDV